ncbi:MAG: 2,3-bisphosphoglycerate-dependent phosphoglycerate mutase [Parasphingorhabdus sp.]|jgi:2,3-bisphosphoglycerate-dependent phosphoglycerate mutase
MRLYLIRHGESENNVLYQGSENTPGRKPDPTLSDKGHSQARLLGEHLVTPGNEPMQHPYHSGNDYDHGIKTLYCSLMLRSILTAGYVAKTCNLKAEALLDVFERKGLYEVNESGAETGIAGPGRDYFSEHFPELILPQSLTTDGWYNRTVESDTEFVARVESSLENLLQQHGNSNDHIALVAHGDYVDQFINAIMQINRHKENYAGAWEANWVSHNTAITRVDFADRYCSVIYSNRTEHLPAELITW